MKTIRGLALLLALPLLGLVLLALPTPAARANPGSIILHVTTSGSPWPCDLAGDWTNPCTLDAALGNSSPGDEIWVAAGIYTPTVGVTQTATFQLPLGVAIYGGFAGVETSLSQRNLTNVTILSGDIGVPGDPTDNAFHVVTGSGTDSTAILDGFTVTGGNANGTSPDDSGAGMYNDGGSPTLANLIFSNNSAAAGYGGAISNNNSSSPALNNVTFNGNSASFGGGMSNDASSPTLTRVTFFNNSATLQGGGMYGTNSSSPKVSNTTFYSNSANIGGGMDNESFSSATITNTTFMSNTAGSFGGGMYTWNSSPTLTNVTFANNAAGINGGGMDNEQSGTTIRNAILWGNTAPSGSQIYNTAGTPSVSDSVVQGGYAGGPVITADPLLGALGNYGGSTQTIPLLPGSSAIDTGNDTTCAPRDQRNIVRPQGAHCDIGAYESRRFTLAKTSGDNQSTLVNSAFAAPLRVTVSSGHGEPVNGGLVTFAAPLSGASATPVTSTVAIVTGAVTLTLTANGIGGSYALSANTAGAIAPVTFTLTNTGVVIYDSYLPLLQK